MVNKILTPVLLLFSTNCFCQHNVIKNDLLDANITGEVEYIEFWKYEIDYDEGADTILLREWKQYYDIYGNMIKSINLDFDNEMIRIFKFNNKNEKIKITEFKIFRGDTLDCNTSTFKYNSMGKKISSEQKCCDKDKQCYLFYHYVNFYDDRGFIYRYISFDRSGTQTDDLYIPVEYVQNKRTYWGSGGKNSKYEFVSYFDKSDRVIKSTTYFDGKVIATSNVTYDTLGRIIEERRFDNGDKEYNGKWTWIYKYDKNGNHIDLIGKNDHGEKEINYAEYDFDIYGNWTKRRHFKNQQLIYITQRKISYY